jgi:prephenate dehydratase
MKILYQGLPGAYSHLAALEIYPEAKIIPCKTFDECFSKAKEDNKLKIIIPESNRITGNIGIEYLMFKHRLNIHAEFFLMLKLYLNVLIL